MFSLFFINRPIFATVISILITVLGAVALLNLPVARYPDLAPPTIQISAAYPGADAKTVSDTVAATIEKEVNGVEGMIYMSSVSGNDGSMSLTVTFEPGTDLDTANVLVQNRVSKAQPRLPEEVKRTGVTVKKRSTDTVMFIALTSPEGTYDAAYLSNYSNLRIRDELSRVPGVGDVTVFGVGEFSMRLWLNPDLLRARNLTASDVIAAVREQNIQVAAGRVGAAPSPPGTAFEYILSTQGRLAQAEEFENIIVRTGDAGSTIRLRDVARVELGSDTYALSSRLNGVPSATFAIYQIPGSNLMEVAEGVRKKIAELEKSFPEDVAAKVIYDSTEVIRSSIKEVIITLIATLILVVLTVFLFLQNARATLIPTITIPVALIGTFSVLLAMGYSLNILTLFGLVLVIGIVVDDAIIVVENTFVHLEKGLSGKEAAAAAMKEVSGPVIATTLVLLAVFVPTAAMGGITGTMFQQFAVTIAIATVFSSINALTLSPALCGILLKPAHKEPRGLFKLFNRSVEASNRGYRKIVRLCLRFAPIGVIGFILMTGGSILGLKSLPTGFVPQEDEGYCMIGIQLPDGATLERTLDVMAKVEKIVAGIEGTVDCGTIAGYSVIDGSAAANTGFCVVTFKNWDERKKDPNLHQSAILAKLQRQLFSIQEAGAFAFAMPSLPGVGVSGGFTFMLQDKEGIGLEQLQAVSNEVIATAAADPTLAGVRTTFRASVPQIYVDIDREQVKRTGTSLTSVFETMQVNLGSAYVNDFTLFGRVFKVTAQADSPFRDSPDDINALHVRGADGQMIPLGAVAELKDVLGPQNVSRFNMLPAVKILGGPAPGSSSGAAMDTMETIARTTLPASTTFSWSELSFQQKQAGTGLAIIFGFAILMVYLVLAAQYESWTLPISVCLSVPAALLGAYLAIQFRGMENNVYSQIGIILLIAMATKTAILLTEFAKLKRNEGLSIKDAALSSVELRFRAVMMTALSFVLGVIPLLIASGAGAESRKILGTAVFGGMIASTLVSLAAVPMLFYVIQSLSERFSRQSPENPAD